MHQFLFNAITLTCLVSCHHTWKEKPLEVLTTIKEVRQSQFLTRHNNFEMCLNSVLILYFYCPIDLENSSICLIEGVRNIMTLIIANVS